MNIPLVMRGAFHDSGNLQGEITMSNQAEYPYVTRLNVISPWRLPESWKAPRITSGIFIWTLRKSSRSNFFGLAGKEESPGTITLEQRRLLAAQRIAKVVVVKLGCHASAWRAVSESNLNEQGLVVFF